MEPFEVASAIDEIDTIRHYNNIMVALRGPEASSAKSFDLGCKYNGYCPSNKDIADLLKYARKIEKATDIKNDDIPGMAIVANGILITSETVYLEKLPSGHPHIRLGIFTADGMIMIDGHYLMDGMRIGDRIEVLGITGHIAKTHKGDLVTMAPMAIFKAGSLAKYWNSDGSMKPEKEEDAAVAP